VGVCFTCHSNGASWTSSRGLGSYEYGMSQQQSREGEGEVARERSLARERRSHERCCGGCVVRETVDECLGFVFLIIYRR
jgi:hypothetical protein